jgi:hypothetical protein
VVTVRPSTKIAGSKHADINVPSTKMLHAPHTPILQPTLVPVKPISSRKRSTSNTSGPTARSIVASLSWNEI